MRSLPPAPLRDWIAHELRRGSTRTALAERLGVDRRQLWRWQYEDGFCHLGAAERALTRAGVVLSEIYGELPDLLPARRRGGIRCRRCGDQLLEPAELCGFCLEELDQEEALAA